MERNLFFDHCFQILTALVPHFDKNRGRESASGLVFVRAGRWRVTEDALVAHGGILNWTLAI